MRLVFMGSPSFAVPSLRALATAGEVVGVYTRAAKPAGRKMILTPTPIEEAALSLGIPVFTPRTLRTPEAQAQLAALKPDYIIVFAYGLILPREVLDIAPCVCVHPSLLPLWRGPNPILRAVESGLDTTGVCLMGMDEGVDTGPVLMTQELTITDMTRGEVELEIASISADMLVRYLADPVAHPPVAQTGPATYAAKLAPGEARIDLDSDAVANYHKILALAPYPCAWFEEAGRRVKILKAGLNKEGKLELQEVQPEGKRPMAYSAYANGLRRETG